MGRTKNAYIVSNNMFYINVNFMVNGKQIQGILLNDPTDMLYIDLMQTKMASNGYKQYYMSGFGCTKEEIIKWFDSNENLSQLTKHPKLFSKGQLLRVRPQIIYILNFIEASPVIDWKLRGDSRITQKHYFKEMGWILTR